MFIEFNGSFIRPESVDAVVATYNEGSHTAGCYLQLAGGNRIYLPGREAKAVSDQLSRLEFQNELDSAPAPTVKVSGE